MSNETSFRDLLRLNPNDELAYKNALRLLTRNSKDGHAVASRIMRSLGNVLFIELGSPHTPTQIQTKNFMTSKQGGVNAISRIYNAGPEVWALTQSEKPDGHQNGVAVSRSGGLMRFYTNINSTEPITIAKEYSPQDFCQSMDWYGQLNPNASNIPPLIQWEKTFILTAAVIGAELIQHANRQVTTA